MPAVTVPVVAWSSATAGTWTSWNNVYFTATTSSCTVTDSTWLAWSGGTGSYSATTMTTAYQPVTWATWNAVHEETAEQRADRERVATEAAAAARARQEAYQAARAEARARALETLGMVLTAGQLASYAEHGWFEVMSSKGRRWRIRDRGQSGNVDLMPEIGDEREATYCAHPPGQLPDADAHLAQALTLATDEDAFLRVANCHYRRRAA